MNQKWSYFLRDSKDRLDLTLKRPKQHRSQAPNVPDLAQTVKPWSDLFKIFKSLKSQKSFISNWNLSSSCYVPLGVFGFSFLILIIACILTFFVFRSHVIGSREFNFLSPNKSYRTPNSCNLLLSLFVLQKNFKWL